MVRPASIEALESSGSLRPRPAGGAGTSVRSGVVEDLELNPEVKGDLWYGDGIRLGLAQQMMRDCHVRQSVDARVSPLCAALWDVQPVSDDDLDMEIADYVKYALIETRPGGLDWVGFVRQGTVGYTRDGAYAAELTEDTIEIPTARFPRHPGGGVGVVYTGIHHRPMSSKRRWIQSPFNPARVLGMVQWLQGSDEEEAGECEISLAKGDLFFRLTYEQEGADFDGFAQARSSWGPFKEKRLIKIIKMIRHERGGAPLPELTEPDANIGSAADKTEDDIAKEILRNLRSHEQAYLRLPPGWKFRWVPGVTDSTGLGDDEERCNRDIAYNMGVAWNLSGMATEGSRALATTQQGQYILSVEKEARGWEFAVNCGQDGWSMVERIVRKNYGRKVGIPRVLVSNMPLRDLTDQLTAVPQLIQTGALVVDKPLRARIRVTMGFPKEDLKTATPYAPSPTAPNVAPPEKPGPKTEARA